MRSSLNISRATNTSFIVALLIGSLFISKITRLNATRLGKISLNFHSVTLVSISFCTDCNSDSRSVFREKFLESILYLLNARNASNSFFNISSEKFSLLGDHGKVIFIKNTYYNEIILSYFLKESILLTKKLFFQKPRNKNTGSFFVIFPIGSSGISRLLERNS